MAGSLAIVVSEFDHQMASIDNSGMAPFVLSVAISSPVGEDRNGDSTRKCPFHRRSIHTLNQFIVDVAKANPQIIAGRREIAPSQLLVNRHQGKIGFRQGVWYVHHALGRMTGRKLDPLCQIVSRNAPGIFSDRRRDRIAVKDRKHDRS